MGSLIVDYWDDVIESHFRSFFEIAEEDWSDKFILNIYSGEMGTNTSRNRPRFRCQMQLS